MKKKIKVDCENCIFYDQVIREKDQRIAELEEENKQLKAEPEKVWSDNLQEIKNDIVDQFIEQIHKEYRKEFNRRLEEKTKSIKDDFENQRRLLTEGYNNQIDELQEQCDRHLKSRVELIKQITGLQEENAKLKEQLKNIVDNVCENIKDEVLKLDILKDTQSCAGVYTFNKIIDEVKSEAQKYLEEHK